MNRLNRWLIPLGTLALVSTLAAIALWRENQALRAQLSTPRAAEAAPTPLPPDQPAVVFRIGNELPEFTARDTEGNELRVARRSGSKSLLFIFEPGCPRCAATLPGWIEIFDRLSASGAKIRVLGLSTGPSYETVEYARSNGIPFPVVPFPSDALRRRYGVVEVPLSVVVSAQGTVEAFWPKPLTSGETADIVELVCPECGIESAR